MTSILNSHSKSPTEKPMRVYQEISHFSAGGMTKHIRKQFQLEHLVILSSFFKKRTGFPLLFGKLFIHSSLDLLWNILIFH